MATLVTEPLATALAPAAIVHTGSLAIAGRSHVVVAVEIISPCP